MSMRNRVVVYAAALMTLAVMANGAQAYQCKSSYKHAEAVGKQLFKAKKSARDIWASTVTSAYGLQWSSWDIAVSKSWDCDHTGNQFYCKVKAKPCLYVVQ
jgi:hypothetical protein